jgi:hypothetical protein
MTEIPKFDVYVNKAVTVSRNPLFLESVVQGGCIFFHYQDGDMSRMPKIRSLLASNVLTVRQSVTREVLRVTSAMIEDAKQFGCKVSTTYAFPNEFFIKMQVPKNDVDPAPAMAEM